MIKDQVPNVPGRSASVPVVPSGTRTALEQREARWNPAELREELLSLVGSPYGDPRFQPADCWGFVRYCYSLAGIKLPKSIWSCRHICREVSAERREILDVIYFRDFILEARHVGVALDNLYVLQSSRTTNGVAALRLNRPGVMESIEGIYRLKS